MTVVAGILFLWRPSRKKEVYFHVLYPSSFKLLKVGIHILFSKNRATNYILFPVFKVTNKLHKYFRKQNIYTPKGPAAFAYVFLFFWDFCVICWWLWKPWKLLICWPIFREWKNHVYAYYWRFTSTPCPPNSLFTIYINPIQYS